MPDGLLPVTSAAAPRYRYYTVNIVTNTVIGEIPFEDVGFQRSLKTAGAFDGKITISDQTTNLDLYNSTLPGKTALYVVRDNQAVWGGIIWGRTYDLQGRSLAISASEFPSYFSHRMIWKSYSQSFTSQVIKPTKDSYCLVTLQDKTLKEPLPVTDASNNPTYVSVKFVDNALRKYNGFYPLVGTASAPAAAADPGRTAFYVDIPNLPPLKDTFYDGVGITLKADTYAYLRDILESTLSDFIDVEFPNEIITPGIKVPYRLATKQLAIANSVYGTATLTTTDVHDLTVGQRVEVVNVDYMLDGQHVISEVPNKYTFRYVLDHPLSRSDGASPIYLDASLSVATPVTPNRDMVQYREVVQTLPQYVKRLSRTSGLVKVTFNSVHNFKKGNKVIVNFEKSSATIFKITVEKKDSKGKVTSSKVEDVNTFDYTKYNNTVTVESSTPTTITYQDPNPDYADSKYDRAANTKSVSKNSVKLATPLPLLRVYPSTSSGYNIGDDIRIDGVDDAGWGYPIYDGYHKVYDVDPGTSLAVNSYLVNPEFITEDEDDANNYIDAIVYLYTDTDAGYDDGDWITVAGIDTHPKLNGRYQVTEPTYFDALTLKFITKYRKNGYSAVSLTTDTGVTVTKTGAGWIAYQPATSETRFALKSEPDSDTAIEKLFYTAAKGKTKNKVTITTKTRHGLAVGDTVKLTFTASGKTDKTQDTYGGTVVVTSVGDFDEFSYTLVKGKHKESAPKDSTPNAVSKKGTATRVRHSVLNPPHIQVPIEGLRAEAVDSGGSLVTIYSPDHDLTVNDYVSVSIDNKTYKSYSTTETPVKIKAAAANYFTYQSGSPTIAGDSSTATAIKYLESGAKVRLTVPKFGTYTAVNKTASSITFEPTSGHVTFTTSTAHGLTAGRRVTISGFPDPVSQSIAGTTTYPTIAPDSVLSFDVVTKSLRIRFSTKHGLNALEDPMSATITIAGANSNASFPSGTGRFNGVELSWLNDTHTISAIPDEYSVEIKCLRFTQSWIVYVNNYGLGLSTTVSLTTATKPAVFLPASDYSKFNFTADVVSAPTTTKLVFNYPDTANPKLTGTKTMASLGITVSLAAPAQKGTGSEQLAVGDFIKISGLTDNTKAKDYYSKLNGDGIKVLAVTSKDSLTNYVTIANPVKSGGKFVSYTNKDFASPGTVIRGYDVGGNVIVSNAQGFAGVDKNAYSIESVASGGVVSATGTIGTVTTSGGYYIANVTLATTVGLSVGEIVKATAGTGNFGSGVVTVTAIDTATNVVSVKSTLTFTAGTITNLCGMAATVTITGTHDMLVGEYVNVRVFNDDLDSFSQANKDLVLIDVTEDTIKYNRTSATSIDYVSYSAALGTVYFSDGVSGVHDYNVGDTITVTGLLSPYTAFNGTGKTIVATGPNSVSYAVSSAPQKVSRVAVSAGTLSRTAHVSVGDAVSGVVTKVPSIMRTPVVFARTYGEFPGSAGIGGLSLSTQEYSNKNMANSPIYGSKLQTLSEILEAYSNTKSGFDYRVDVALEYDADGNKVFTRTFILKPIIPQSLTDYLATLPDGKLARGQVATPNAFGADKVVFEYPGNISNVSLAEKAESSATRVFVSGNSSGAGSGAEAPYAAAAATDLLADNWPLLDKKESVKWPSANTEADTSATANVDDWGNHDDETDYHTSAVRFLSEFRPPAGDFTIDINGSLTPVIGSYDPGDWCSIIINDDFVKTRLNSVLEPRKDVIVRKIDAIKVSVPNNPAFPEKISLSLVADWEVDAVGK